MGRLHKYAKEQILPISGFWVDGVSLIPLRDDQWVVGSASIGFGSETLLQLKKSNVVVITASGRTVSVSGVLTELYAALLRSYFENNFDWSSVKKDLLTDAEIAALVLSKKTIDIKGHYMDFWDFKDSKFGDLTNQRRSLVGKGLLKYVPGKKDPTSGWAMSYYLLTSLGEKAYQTLKKQGRIK